MYTCIITIIIIIVNIYLLLYSLLFFKSVQIEFILDKIILFFVLYFLQQKLKNKNYENRKNNMFVSIGRSNHNYISISFD
jgi:hypothetical protein